MFHIFKFKKNSAFSSPDKNGCPGLDRSVPIIYSNDKILVSHIIGNKEVMEKPNYRLIKNRPDSRHVHRF